MRSRQNLQGQALRRLQQVCREIRPSLPMDQQLRRVQQPQRFHVLCLLLVPDVNDVSGLDVRLAGQSQRHE